MKKPAAALLVVVALAAPSQAHALTRGTHVVAPRAGSAEPLTDGHLGRESAPMGAAGIEPATNPL